jgi:urea transporter
VLAHYTNKTAKFTLLLDLSTPTALASSTNVMSAASTAVLHAVTCGLSGRPATRFMASYVLSWLVISSSGEVDIHMPAVAHGLLPQTLDAHQSAGSSVLLGAMQSQCC